MKKITIGINGFGRIGRAALKIALKNEDIKIVAINDLTDVETLANLLQFDSIYGKYDKKVGYDLENIIINGEEIKVLSEKEPRKLPWKKMDIDLVLECTGRFTERQLAASHLEAGAKKVIISAPSKGESPAPTYIIGVNEDKIAKNARIINNGSCTTNCVAPIMKIIGQKLGIKKATMTTIHSYTADQNLQDGPHKDLRRSRAAALNIIPTTTGAAISTGEAIPELKGIFDGLSLRVPTPIVSLSDFTILTEKNTSAEEINQIFEKSAASSPYRGIVSISRAPLVSADLIKNPSSAIIDFEFTKVIGGNLIKIIAWYDNEWGYANRLVEMIPIFS